MLFRADAPLVLLLALVLDALIGDPDRVWRRLPHPVAWFGALVALLDRMLNRESWSAETRRTAGILSVAALLGAAFVPALLLEAALRAIPAGDVLVALIASVFLAQRSLHAHVRRVREAFAEGGLPAARRAVSMIVGRDPERLDEAGVARAAIESTAENFSDGVVAPAFWFALLGLPGLVAYKAINTADSMIGHLSVRHRDFGWAAARLDDLLNLVPARLAGFLLAAAAWTVRGSPGEAARVMLRDAGIHRSPNAGWPEAAMAGALRLALGGPRIYAAGPVDEPFLNAPGRRDAGPQDISRALRVMAAACVLHGLFYGALALVVI
ncbi:adenosylcobinamide-phosphate synthase CbiB [Enterovirga aerilata]|uniref:Cobalamin biosynthesis protein CobD n=1 Tax=Enterovirga aerilata TaxID=2730920 RepID=A0A849I0J5_9HYPH|nr:adenosylcobinamide-phosphate synthase CbiB [Enterovirga sp. DB1703]NNM72862.1 cobalamin biosynthesis protein [Enterovirga sp. DB1703]